MGTPVLVNVNIKKDIMDFIYKLYLFIGLSLAIIASNYIPARSAILNNVNAKYLDGKTRSYYEALSGGVTIYSFTPYLFSSPSETTLNTKFDVITGNYTKEGKIVSFYVSFIASDNIQSFPQINSEQIYLKIPYGTIKENSLIGNWTCYQNGETTYSGALHYNNGIYLTGGYDFINLIYLFLITDNYSAPFIINLSNTEKTTITISGRYLIQ
jgi:hypothetical protein